ncbi:MAG: arginase family protein [Gemmatimonadaceae bacterium]
MKIDLILVPYDSAQRGVRMGAGPEHLIASGLPGHLERLGHVVELTTVDPPLESWRAEIHTAFELAALIAASVRDSQRRGAFPVVLAGNCFASLGAVTALGAGTGVLWFDAHGDFNTPETTTGGFLDGMALATLTGRCFTGMCARLPGFVPIREQHAWLLGTRDLDPAEEEVLLDSLIGRVGAESIGAELMERIRWELDSPRQIHVHLDLDVLDPSDGHVNDYACEGGVSAANLRLAMRSLGALDTVAALTLSAYDPSFDSDGRVCATAFDVLESFFTES